MPTAILLGNAQDGGVPQAGCRCDTCTAAWADPRRRRCVSALGLLDQEAGQYFLVDATPDLRAQLHALQVAAPHARLGGLLLTHAHMGHYTGLVHLGFEALATHGLPLYASAALLAFLRQHAPWRQLFDQGNVVGRVVPPAGPLALTPTLTVLAQPVPHRAEWSDTVAYTVRGPRRQLLYLPDIDSWEAWATPPFGQDLRAVVSAVDVALLDGCFYSPAELPGRDLRRIGHPFVTDTAARLAGLVAQVYLIHLNHSNPLYRAGPELAAVEAQGLLVGAEGQRWEL